MERTILFILLGYCSGSVLYALVFARLFKKGDILSKSKDGNPGTTNAFLYGGFWCGVLTLCCELLKGAIPVLWYLKGQPVEELGIWSVALVLAAPVLGHLYPVFADFHGGKGIAVTFGVLLGLVPYWAPVLTFCFFFLFYSLIVRVQPHFYRTIVTYVSMFVTLLFAWRTKGIVLGFGLICCGVLRRLHESTEKREKMKVGFLWKY